jgi:pyridoxamine 5'-phosphate oxidase
MRDHLRSLRVFVGAIPEFDPETVPSDPAELFGRWLHHAAEHGVLEPHAITLSTTDDSGQPDARIVILKDLVDDHWWFATNAASPKGVQLVQQPAVALTFYWPAVARQVRVRGAVAPGSPELSAADFRERGLGARAVALASKESQPLSDRAHCAEAVADARSRLAAEPARSRRAGLDGLCAHRPHR